MPDSDTINNQLILLKIHRGNAKILRRQLSQFGPAYAPMHIVSEMKHNLGAISTIKKWLTSNSAGFETDDVDTFDLSPYLEG